MRHWHRDKFPASWKHAKHWPGIISEYALPFLSQFTLNDLETCWCSSLRRITIISTYSPVEKEQVFPCLVLQLFVCNTGNEPIRQQNFFVIESKMQQSNSVSPRNDSIVIIFSSDIMSFSALMAAYQSFSSPLCFRLKCPISCWRDYCEIL